MRFVERNGMRLLVVPRADFSRPYFALLCQLCEAQNWRCCYCGIPMEIGREGEWTEDAWKTTLDMRATVEHVVPKIDGGSNKWINLAAACRLCNNARSSMKADRYIRFVQWKGREGAARYANRIRSKIQRRQSLARIAADGQSSREP